jgi:hypothetical protein
MRVAARRRLPLLVAATVLLAPLSTVANATPPSPTPTVALTSPTAGTQVAGFVSVTGSAAVDPTVNDTAQTLQFYVDGTYVTQHACAETDPRSCTATFTWDTTTLYGTHALQLKFRTGNGIVAVSLVVSLQVGDPPSALLTSPKGGATVTGVISVAGGGTVDALQPDTAKALQLLVDGTPAGSTPCTDDTTCTGRLSWDSTGLSGAHTLQLKLSTAKGQTGLSPIVTVMANNPGPAVVLRAPAVATGVTAVPVVGTVDATQTDAGALVRLLVDGRSAATAPCPAALKTCAVSVSWNSKGLAGPHNLTAQFTTTGGRTVSSAVSPVWVFSTVKVSLAKPVGVAAGRTGSLTGRVIAVDGSGAAGLPVRLVVQNSLGQAGTDVTVVTGPNGAFTASYKAVSNSSVTASVLASAHYGAGNATAKVSVAAVPTCTLRATVGHGVATPVGCRLGGLTKGTAIALQTLQGHDWRTVTSARSTGATWSVGHVFAAKGTYWVRVSAAACRDFAAATSVPVKVVVS